MVNYNNLTQKEYERLVKDADDNRAVLWVIRWSVLIMLFIFVMAVYGCHAIDMKKQIDQANVSVKVREIESQGLKYDQYIEWLDAKNGE